MLYENIEALRGARDVEAFVAACRSLIEGSPHAGYHPAALDDLVPLVRATKATGWDWYLRDPEAPLADVWFEFVFNAAMNGGYFKRNMLTGEIAQWAHKGSGSEALVVWIGKLREQKLMPGIDYVAPGGHCEPGYRAAIDELLCGLPYASERRAIIEEFAAPGAYLRAAHAIDGLRELEGGRIEGAMGMAAVRRLAASFPTAFGADPFAKKACLAVLMLAGNLVSRGHPVQAFVPIPADYQIPRALHFKGAISISDRLASALRAGRMLDPASEPVTHFRAAAVVAAHDLGRLAGAPDWLVDGAIFNTFRKDPDFQANALPPMKIHGMWF